jgi:molybdopterin synthase catalytic subunit
MQAGVEMDKNKLIEKMQNHPDYHRIGMVASHLGVVRGHSRDGRMVTGVDVQYDMDQLDKIINEIKLMPGIIEVLAEVNSGSLNVGDELLHLAVGGDIRENVFPALMRGVDLIKHDAVKKREIME